MAGDWLKIEVITPDKPEIFDIAEALSITSDDVFGKCFRVWAWFDAHTTDGKCNGVIVTKMLVDRCAGITGFANAMLKVSWLIDGEQGLTIPNFDRHNGETAKQRALSAKRVAKSRAKSYAESNGDSVTSSQPEKRREENKDKDIQPLALLMSLGVEKKFAQDWLKVRNKKKLTFTQAALDQVVDEAKKAGFTLNQALQKCCQESWGGFKAHWLTEEAKADPDDWRRDL